SGWHDDGRRHRPNRPSRRCQRPRSRATEALEKLFAALGDITPPAVAGAKAARTLAMCGVGFRVRGDCLANERRGLAPLFTSQALECAVVRFIQVHGGLFDGRHMAPYIALVGTGSTSRTPG